MSWRRTALLYIRRYFPAYFPGVIIVIKWGTLYALDRYTLHNTIVDVPFASLSFAVWVVTQPKSPAAADDTAERMVGAASLLVNALLFLLGVKAWIVTPDALAMRFIVTGLAVILFILVPCMVLERPNGRSTQDGGSSG